MSDPKVPTKGSCGVGTDVGISPTNFSAYRSGARVVFRSSLHLGPTGLESRTSPTVPGPDPSRPLPYRGDLVSSLDTPCPLTSPAE